MEKIIECASLMHDVNNSPYEHYGEDIIRKYFSDNWKTLKNTKYTYNEKGKLVKDKEVIELN